MSDDRERPAEPSAGPEAERSGASAGRQEERADPSQAAAAFDVISDYLRPGRENVMLIYILYLAGLVPVFGGVPIFVGFVMSILNRAEGGAVWESHYEFQMRQAIVGFIAAAICFVLLFILIGFIGMVLVAIWWLVRSVKGLMAAGRGEPIHDPRTYAW